MAFALDIGTIDIKDPKLVSFIKHRNSDEIKALFVNFLKQEAKTNHQKEQHKWAEFGEKMHGLIDNETANSLQKSANEFRRNFFSENKTTNK